MTSKTKLAMALVDQGMVPYAAAKQVGASTPSLYKALALRASRDTCPTCGSVVAKTRIKDEFERVQQAPPMDTNAAIQILERDIRASNPARRSALVRSLAALVRIAEQL